MEFMLIIVVILTYLQVLVVPLFKFTDSISRDLSKVAKARFFLDEVSRTIDFLGASAPGSSVTLTLFLDRNTYVECSSGLRAVVTGVDVGSDINLAKGFCSFDSKTCEITLVPRYSFTCTPSRVEGPRAFTVVVERTEGDVEVRFQ